MSRIRGVFDYDLVSKSFMYWLSKYEHEFLGWASCPTLPYWVNVVPANDGTKPILWEVVFSETGSSAPTFSRWLLASMQGRQLGKYCSSMLMSHALIWGPSMVSPLMAHTRAWKQIFSHCVTVNRFQNSNGQSISYWKLKQTDRIPRPILFCSGICWWNRVRHPSYFIFSLFSNYLFCL